MVRFQYLIFINVWFIFINATTEPTNLTQISEWYDKYNAKILKETYPDGKYQISANNPKNHNDFYYFANDELFPPEDGDITDGTTAKSETLNARTIFVDLIDIKIWKGRIQGEWHAQKKFTGPVEYGMIIGKKCRDKADENSCKWYIIEDFDDATNQKTVYLEPKIDYKPGFYVNYDVNVNQKFFDDSNMNKPNTSDMYHAIFIQKIQEKEKNKQIFVLGQAVGSKWFLIEVIGETAGESIDSTQNEKRGRKFKLHSENEFDLEKLKAEAAENTVTKAALKDKDDQLKKEIKQKENYESKIWYLEFIIGFLGCLVVCLVLVFLYLIFYRFKERIFRAEEDGKAQEFNIGDKVNIRNTKKQEWRLGRVVQLKPTLKVLADGWEKAYEWKFIEKFVPSPVKIQKEYFQPKLPSFSAPKKILPGTEKATKPRTIIIHSDEAIDVWQNTDEEIQEKAIQSPSISAFMSTNFSTLESTLSDISSMSCFTTNFTTPNLTEELLKHRVSSGSLPTISDLTFSSSLKH